MLQNLNHIIYQIHFNLSTKRIDFQIDRLLIYLLQICVLSFLLQLHQNATADIKLIWGHFDVSLTPRKPRNVNKKTSNWSCNKDAVEVWRTDKQGSAASIRHLLSWRLHSPGKWLKCMNQWDGRKEIASEWCRTHAHAHTHTLTHVWASKLVLLQLWTGLDWFLSDILTLFSVYWSTWRSPPQPGVGCWPTAANQMTRVSLHLLLSW